MDENEKITRDSFVFYRSFFEAVSAIENPADKAIAYDAICELALNGNEIELSGIPKIIIPLIKPQIYANNKKYVNGCKKKRTKDEPKQEQNISKTQAKHKQNKE